jgi:hypothetical protein
MRTSSSLSHGTRAVREGTHGMGTSSSLSASEAVERPVAKRLYR